MTLAFTYWMLRKRDKRSGRSNRFHDMRLILLKQSRDFGKRGKGNRAWKRADAVIKQLGRVTVDPYQIARGL